MLFLECLPNFKTPRGRVSQLFLGHCAAQNFRGQSSRNSCIQVSVTSNYCSCCIFKLRSLSHCASNSTLGHFVPRFCPPAEQSQAPRQLNSKIPPAGCLRVSSLLPYHLTGACRGAAPAKLPWPISDCLTPPAAANPQQLCNSTPSLEHTRDWAQHPTRGNSGSASPVRESTAPTFQLSTPALLPQDSGPQLLPLSQESQSPVSSSLGILAQATLLLRRQ